MGLSFDIDKMKDAVERFGTARILVIGDVMLDQFIWGRVGRISPEAPVPVVEVDQETYMLGGAANVVHNLAALGCRTLVCGLVGDDEAGKHVCELLEDLEVPCDGVIRSDARPTTVKTRVVAHSQQVVRVDREHRLPARDSEVEDMQTYLDKILPDCDAVIISDYAKGVISQKLLGPLMEKSRKGQKIITVDPKVSNMQLYAGATVITPNHHEALAAARINGDDPKAIIKAGRRLLEELEAKHVLVTQSEKGMTLFTKGQETHIPTMAKKVFDVTGAGDTVISTLTLGLVAGLTPPDAAAMANFAAGVVVGEVGTSAVTAGRLARALDENAQALAQLTPNGHPAH